jgi:hypothetical protein
MHARAHKRIAIASNSSCTSALQKDAIDIDHHANVIALLSCTPSTLSSAPEDHQEHTDIHLWPYVAGNTPET